MADRHDLQTVIGPDTHIKGEMVFDHNACILGKFEGRIVAKGRLEIGDTALCKASLDALQIIVQGTVEGDIVAREKLELQAGASVVGDIVATKLTVAEGASFTGHCRVGEQAANAGTPGASAPAAMTNGTAPAPMVRPTLTARPRVVTTPAASDIENTLAGFESKLAEFGRTKAVAE